MHALYVVIPVIGILAIGYRYYSAFIAARIWMLDDSRVTPAQLVGPMLAAQFGYAPGLIWLVAGVVLAGAVHDSMILWASTRRGGRSLAEIVKEEISPAAGIVASIAIIFIIVLALAGLGI